MLIKLNYANHDSDGQLLATFLKKTLVDYTWFVLLDSPSNAY